MRNMVGNSRTVALVAVLFALAFAPQLQAGGESSETAIRQDHPLGGYVSLYGDPFPALMGANIAYNVYDWARLTAGVGTDSTSTIHSTTFGVGAKATVPGWALTPIAGLNWSADTGDNSTIRGIQHGANRLYFNVGLDWTTALGINLGGGYVAGLTNGGGGSGYLQAGFFL